MIKFISPFDVHPEYTINVNSNVTSSNNNEFTRLLQQHNNETLGKDEFSSSCPFVSSQSNCTTSSASSAKSVTDYHSFVDDLLSQKDIKSSHLFSPHAHALVSEPSSSQLSEGDEEDEEDEERETQFEEDKEFQKKSEMVRKQKDAGRKSSLLRKTSVYKWKTQEIDNLTGEISQQIQSLQKLRETENFGNIPKDRD